LPKRQRRRRRISGAYAGPQRTKLPFPINVILNQKFFYMFFIIIMIASMAAVGLGNFGGSNADPPPVFDPAATPEPTGEAVNSFPEGPAPVIDATKPYVATISTNMGDIKVDLATDAPKAVNSFAFLAGNGFYNDTALFYVNQDTFAQGGDPNCSPDGETLCSGTGGPDYTLPFEEGSMSHDQWVVVAPFVTAGQEVHGSQFRILYNADPRLNGTETVFGRVSDPASQEILASIGNFELCSVVETSTCVDDQSFSNTLVIEKVVVQPV
jgi:cyclophilin family peptidyl-prolyl cis-trans isomerase